MSYATARSRKANGEANKLYPEDRPVHEWYRFVLSFPPHLVREYLGRFAVGNRQRVLDPFCGTGTVLVECKKLGVPSVGIEANPMAHLAAAVKTDWGVDPGGLLAHSRLVGELACARLRTQGIEDEPLFASEGTCACELRGLDEGRSSLLLDGSISALPLHKALVLLDVLREERDERFFRHELVALAKALVFSASNLHFGPEVGVGRPRVDVPVVSPWLAGVAGMTRDLEACGEGGATRAFVHLADARRIAEVVEPESIDAVITSPPYPNEKDYTRTTRLESVILGFLASKRDLQALKHTLVRSNTRGVYRSDDDDAWVAQHPEINRIAREIEARRVELGKTSGFERTYARVTRLYFGGMARHLSDLRRVLKPGARLAYVVGDQASYLRVMIRTGQLLGDLAEGLGYRVEGIDLFRTRTATATREQLREEVLILRWPGGATA